MPMSRQLAEAVAAAFRIDTPQGLRSHFAEFGERDWRRTKRWLHTSGMALYFLDHMTKLGVQDVLPAELVHELSVNLAENRVRNADMFEEFARLNTGFMRAGISYLNLKGFSLAPAAFPDPALRCLLDLDFLVARRDIERAAGVMEAHGYRLKNSHPDTWEFCTGTPVKSSLKDLYRIRPLKSVELHLVPKAEEDRARLGRDRMSRMQLQVWNGFEFPALSEADKLLSQATHLFQHFLWQWTRVAWLHEYSNAIRSHQSDAAIWCEAVAAIHAVPEIRTGVALATLVTSQTFGTPVPEEFAAQTIGMLKPELHLWVERYRRDLVFTDHPGSKLYLLLLDVLEGDCPEWQATRRRRLLPLHRPPTVVSRPDNSLPVRWVAATAQMRFSTERLKFHLMEGLRYKLEAARWRRFVAGAGL